MRVLHVIPSLSPRHGGPSVALPLIARSLVKGGVIVDVATTDDDGPGGRFDVLLGRREERDGFGVFHFGNQTEFYKVSLPFRSWVRRHAAEYDVVHIHALFSHTSIAAARAARRCGVPYVIRPLGVLNRWGMQNRRRWLKSLSFRFIEQPILRHAAAMHYTSRAEEREAAQSGATAPAAVIPLGIDLGQFERLPDAGLFLRRFPRAAGRTLVFFLSRLDEKKGLDLLLPAFAQIKAKHPAAMLVLAGRGEEAYVAALKKESEQLALADDVLWPGFLAGEEKLSAFAASTMFVLPSYSENFGIALVEALAAGLPCLTTEGVAVSEDVREREAGVVVAAGLGEVAAGLERILSDGPLRQRLGTNARRLAEERFSFEAMGTALKALYQQLASSGRTP